MNYQDQKIRRTLVCDIRKHWNKKDKKLYLYTCPWGYNNYTDAYSQSYWKDMALEATVSSVKISDVTFKTFRLIGQAVTMTNWFCITSVRCGRVWVLHSVVAGSISSGGDHGIRCWWDLIRSKQLSSFSVWRAQVFAGFSGHGNSIHNIIILLKKKKK